MNEEVSEISEVTEGNSDYNRRAIANSIKDALAKDKELAKIVYAWLRMSGLKLTDY